MVLVADGNRTGCTTAGPLDLRVNLGCGRDIRAGWMNVDKASLPGVDVVHDLTSGPLPFPSESCCEVLCKDVLEHLEYIPLLKEIHRILRPGGQLRVRVPHFTSKDAYSDPTHRKLFSVNTFQYFVNGHPRAYYTDFSFAQVCQIRIQFDKRPAYPYNYLMELLVNLNARTQNLFEGSPWRLFPATNVEVVLQK